MKTFACWVLIALVLQIATYGLAQNTPVSESDKGREIATLEKKLLRTWYGPDCGGNFTFNADGTFNVDRYSPGNNTLTGTWSIRWDALPPTLVLTFKTSDFKKKDSSRPEFEYLGKSWEPKLIQLNDAALVYRFPKDKTEFHFSSDAKEGGYTRQVSEE